MIQDRLKQGVADGDVPPTANILALGRFYTGMVQTVGIQAHDGASSAELEDVIDIAMSAWPGGSSPAA